MRRIGLFVVVAVLVVGLLLFNHFMGSISFVEDRVKDLNNLQQKQIDIFLQMNSLSPDLPHLLSGGSALYYGIVARRNKIPHLNC